MFLFSPRLIVVCAVLVALAMPVSQACADGPGPWEFTLVGSGTADQDFDSSNLTGEIGLGYHLGPFVIGARQSVTYTGTDSDVVDDLWSGTTRAFGDLEIKLGPVAPFVGASFGYTYGDLVKDQFIAGPEVGVKLYVGENHEAFIFVRAEYQFLFEDSDAAEEAFDDGMWIFGLGIGVRF
jgi:hypothetical protein